MKIESKKYFFKKLQYFYPISIMFFLLGCSSGSKENLIIVSCRPVQFTKTRKVQHPFPLSKSGNMEFFAFNTKTAQLYEYNDFQERYIPAKESKSSSFTYQYNTSYTTEKLKSLFRDGDLKIIRSINRKSLNSNTQGSTTYRIFNAKKVQDNYQGNYIHSYGSAKQMTCNLVDKITVTNRKSIIGPKPPFQPSKSYTFGG